MQPIPIYPHKPVTHPDLASYLPYRACFARTTRSYDSANGFRYANSVMWAVLYGGGNSGCMCSIRAVCCSAGGKCTVTCCSGVFGGDGVARMPRFRPDSAANVDDDDIVRWRSWPDVFPRCAWLAEPCRGGCCPTGSVAPELRELRELSDVRRSCRDASESVGDGCDRTGEAVLVCILRVGDTAR